MPLQATSGAASYDAFGGGAAAVPNYIEDVFSTYLYTGNGTTLAINNGIDLSTKGGLTWFKQRNLGRDHVLEDTVRGAGNALFSNYTNAQASAFGGVSSYGTTGFTLDGNASEVNANTGTYVSWTFRKQPKFFDVQTWTGNGVSGRQIPHSLGSVPGCMIVKGTSIAENWTVYHRSQGATEFGLLDQTDAFTTSNDRWNNTTPTSTVFTVGNAAKVNASGQTYVAYLFAHNAGGFGLTGTDNVISCGSYTANGNNTIELGYEPQWIMVRRTNTAGNDWEIYDTMRGCSLTGSKILVANTSGAEGVGGTIYPTATGFYNSSFGSGNIIYIAIRRGPMKVPTSGTSVYNAVVRNGTQANATVTGAGFPVDLIYTSLRPAGTHNPVLSDRLRGATKTLGSRGTQAEQTELGAVTSFASMDGVSLGPNNTDFWNGFNSVIGSSYVNWFFRRAPSFFDEVCYLGNGSTQTITHNLGVVPELIIGKNRTTAGNNWPVLFNFASTTMNYGFLNLTNSCPNDTYANVGVFSAAPTSTSMFLVNSGSMNTNTDNHVAYLFASCAGVSKVFSYTGNGSSQTINCGFTGGARFVLIKRTDSTGDWYVWDSARGIVSGNDPHLSLNTTDAEVTTDDTIDTDSTGFVVNQVSATDVNVSSATYIGLAIA